MSPAATIPPRSINATMCRRGGLAFAMLLLLCPAAATGAQRSPDDLVRAVAAATPPRAPARDAVRAGAMLLTGALAGLVVHEGGHALAAASFGAHPGTNPIRYAGIPFFAVTHGAVTRREEFVISSAGLWMQHLGAEWILSTHPDLHHQSARLLKGVLAFDEATLLVYTGAALLERGPPERDPRSMARSLGSSGWPEPSVAPLLLLPALLDGYRYLHPGHRWATRASRGVKLASVALTLVAGR